MIMNDNDVTSFNPIDVKSEFRLARLSVSLLRFFDRELLRDYWFNNFNLNTWYSAGLGLQPYLYDILKGAIVFEI